MKEETTKHKTEEKTNPIEESKKQEDVKNETEKHQELDETQKKHEAKSKSFQLRMSPKQGKYICNFIKNKPIDKAIRDLEEVIAFKKPVPFRGEIPHRKGKIMSGRYPIKAARQFIKILKSLKGNVLVNNLDSDKTIISIASANISSRPARSHNRQGKRTNIVLIAREGGKI